jgi:DNA-3-methyladenine glycosylase II
MSDAVGSPVELVKPDYWPEACRHLARKDRVLKRLIPQFGDACLQSRGDAFTTLARSIVGQQISVKAAQSVWDKFARLPRKMTAANVLKLKVDDMRLAGLSARKIEYLVDLALHFDSGRSMRMPGPRWTTMPSSPNWSASAASAAGPPRCSSSST